MKEILVIGGNAFVGKAIAGHFISCGDHVYVLNRGNHKNISGAIHLKADRNDRQAFHDMIGTHHFDLVIDVCAYLPAQTEIAVSALRGRAKHFIHISSASIYSGDRLPMTEDSGGTGGSAWGEYGVNKYLCEAELNKAWETSAFPMTIIRPFYLYGPENNLYRERYVFDRIVHQQPIILPGTGNTIIQFGYVEDLASCIARMGNDPITFGHAYNAPGEAVTFLDWIKTCEKVLQKKAMVYLADCETVGYMARDWFPFRDTPLFGTCEKLAAHVQFIPGFTLYRGLKKTFGLYSNADLVESNAEREITRNTLALCRMV